MRTLAETVITEAAVAAGIPVSAVMDKPDKETVLLPSRRLQLEFLPASLRPASRMVAKFPTASHPETHRTVRRQAYERTFLVRAEIVSDDESWLEDAVLQFLSALPRRVADGSGNLVTVEALKAELGGFGGKLVEVFTRRRTAIHIQFTGMICRDRDVELIREVNLVDNVSAK